MLCVADPVVIANAGDVADVSEPLEATSVKPVPALAMDSPPNVARPATAFSVVVPLNEAPTEFAPSAIVTAPVNGVATLPAASVAATITFGSVPVAVLLAGDWLNTSFVGVTLVAVALNVAGLEIPAIVAVSVCGPAIPPSVHVADTLPLASVVAVVDPTDPPFDALNATGTPASAAPSVAVTRATTALGSAAPAGPVCPDPLAAAMAPGTGSTTSVATSVAPVSSAAVTCTVPRPMSAVPVPEPAFGNTASAVFEDEKMIGAPATTLFPASSACAENTKPVPAFTA